MRKITCEICGTTYSDTESCCPICGWTQDGFDFGDEITAEQAQLESEAVIRPQETPVKKNREIFDFDAVNSPDPVEQSSDSYEDEDEEEPDEGNRNHSNPLVVILLTVVIVALLGAIAFVVFRYLLPAKNKAEESAPSSEIEQTDTSETTIPTVPCTGLSLTSGKAELKQAGQFWLLHVVVMPEDTTDVLTFASMDESIATVNEEGRVTAVAEGSTTIVITCGSQRIECPVTVDFTPEETTAPSGDALTQEGDSDSTGESQPDATEATTEAVEETTAPASNVVLKLKKTDITFIRAGVYVDLLLDCDLSPDQVEWASANPNVASVKNGAVTAVGPGITNITVTYGDQTVTCIVRCNF